MNMNMFFTIQNLRVPQRDSMCACTPEHIYRSTLSQHLMLHIAYLVERCMYLDHENAGNLFIQGAYPVLLVSVLTYYT